MWNGIFLLWFILVVPSVIFVAVDIYRNTPEAPVMKAAFVILTLFTGPLGAFFYVLGCREPIKGTHAQYVSVAWRQVLGSTMHCAAGDGLGIIVGSAIGLIVGLAVVPNFFLGYVLGFSFGWGYFQAFAMRDMAGGDYLKSLKMTFMPEFLSMNFLMSAMALVTVFAGAHVPGGRDPGMPGFWWIASMSLIAGFICAYPMNWWMVTNHMKHGMITVIDAAAKKAAKARTSEMASGDMSSMHMDGMESADGEMARMEGDMEGMDQGEMSMAGPARGAVIKASIISVSVLAVTVVVVGIWGT